MTLPKLTNKSITMFGRADTPKIKSFLGSFARKLAGIVPLKESNFLIKFVTTVGLSYKDSTVLAGTRLSLNNTHSLICQRFSIKVENFRGFFFDSLSINSLILPLGS